MITTSNYELNKPGPDDFYNINDHNYNYEKIDVQLKSNETNTASNTQQIGVLSQKDIRLFGRNKIFKIAKLDTSNSKSTVSFYIVGGQGTNTDALVIISNTLENGGMGILGNVLVLRDSYPSTPIPQISVDTTGNVYVHTRNYQDYPLVTVLNYNAVELFDGVEVSTGGSYIVPTSKNATTEKTEILFPFATAFTDKGEISFLSKTNNIITLHIAAKKKDGSSMGSWNVIGTLPIGLRPTKSIFFNGMLESSGSNGYCGMYIDTVGAVYITNCSYSTSTSCVGSVSYHV